MRLGVENCLLFLSTFPPEKQASILYLFCVELSMIIRKKMGKFCGENSFTRHQADGPRRLAAGDPFAGLIFAGKMNCPLRRGYGFAKALPRPRGAESCGAGPHSTVTDFARFRGLSISQPRIKAT